MLRYPLIRTGPATSRNLQGIISHYPSVYSCPACLQFRAVQSAQNPYQSSATAEEETDFDRNILNPERYETCKWGADDEVGRHKISYDPSMTTPESEMTAEEEVFKLEGEYHSPLYVSPANREVSELLDPMVGGAVHCADRSGPSARGWTRKHKEIHIKNVPGSRYEQYQKSLEKLRSQKASAEKA
ncbi:hypothetical protein EYZ11_005179 [Aspergillus tanneri]|uniref:Uncharacterized protein n=1 Tax=Aspergillus tanneri TaxID=1220188 RepID=A0A4S3JII2_9EURO|nr:uncharacterized protein ATNIH1004_000093 [Aspergillus tanneri]KAA8651215.1 hypothetical protein ATNIH1004_000093 [Aspergillus tanneri]THC95319.1 hypothetical protein EYZ11_005179 [Aspergillus tanneri]